MKPTIETNKFLQAYTKLLYLR